MWRFLAILAALAGISGCTQHLGVPGRVDPVAVAGVRLPSDVEAAIGARENPRVIAEYGGVYSDPEVEAALARVVSRLVSASNDPSRRYRITILNSPVANAFALPGGYLYVTRGLLVLADDNSELAAVLSHEIAHVLANHALERARAVERSDIVEQVASSILSDPNAGRSAVANSKHTLAKFSRNQEIEADRIGIAIASRAGYDPFAASRFIDKLEQYAAFRSALGRDDDTANFLSTHPAALERRDLAVRAARKIGAPGIGEQGRAAYLKSLDGVIFGDDPSEGFIRGRRFLHPRLAIGFEVPAGYRLENTRDAVLAAAGRETAMRFDGVTAPAGQTPEAYLASGWVNGLITQSIRTMRTNRLPVATASAKADNWDFRIAAVKMETRMYRIIFASRDPRADIDGGLASMLASFRKLTPAESARLRPLRIDIVRAGGGTTSKAMARRMRGVSNGKALFLLLNCLSATDRLVAGQSYKIVTD
ncbi:MAG: M48 family metalloprotease [Alphaproteobacteria bacterium]